MRLEYYCPVILETAKGKPVTDIEVLKKFDGFTENSEGADFTEFMDDDVGGADLIGAPFTLKFAPETSTLFACVGFYPADPITPAQQQQLTEYVIGQFIDGFGSHPIDVRKGLSRYSVICIAGPHDETGGAEVRDYPHACEYETPAFTFVTGPFVVNAPRPKPKVPAKARGQGKEMAIAATNGDLDVVKALIESGCPVDIMRPEEDLHDTVMTGLAWAANRGHEELALYLIAQGANPNMKTGRGDTPLMMANTSEMVSLLLDAGADPSLKNERGFDAVAYFQDQASFWQAGTADFEKARAKAYTDKIAVIQNWKN